MSLRFSIKVRICPHLLVTRDLNLLKPIQQGHSVILMSYKQPRSKSKDYIENFSVADRSDGCYSDATRCSKYSSFAKISRGSFEKPRGAPTRPRRRSACRAKPTKSCSTVDFGPVVCLIFYAFSGHAILQAFSFLTKTIRILFIQF